MPDTRLTDDVCRCAACRTPELSLPEAKERVETMHQHPRVTEQSIKDKILSVEYVTRGTFTIAIIKMANGFTVTGQAAPAHAGNFDPEVGKRFAYDDAFKKIWPLEGYLLCEQLYGTAF